MSGDLTSTFGGETGLPLRVDDVARAPVATGEFDLVAVVRLSSPTHSGRKKSRRIASAKSVLAHRNNWHRNCLWISGAHAWCRAS